MADADTLVASTVELAPTLVLDGLGGAFTRAAIEAMQPGGRLVLYGVSAGDDIALSGRGLYRKGISMLGYTGLRARGRPTGGHVRRPAPLVDDGALRVPVELVPLSDADSAFARIIDRDVGAS